MRTVKVLSLLFVSLMLVQFYANVPVANATPNSKSIQVSGHALISEGIPLWGRISGDSMYIFAKQSATFDGSFEGNVVVYWFISQNLITYETKAVGVGTFTGTMDKKSGTFTFTATGWGFSTIHYEWKIISGTRDFSHMQGEGILDVDVGSLLGNYSGSVSFVNNKH